MEKQGVVHRVSHAALSLLMLGSVTVFSQLPAFAAGRVSLAWDASVDPTVAGYLINYGVASGTYTNALSVGKVTSASISDLVEGTTYFFAAKSYNSANVQSDFSNEASYSVPVSANQPPTLNAIGNLTLGEDAGPQTVNLSGIGSGSVNENQTLTVSAASSNTGLIPNPTITYTSPNATGILTFKPVTNANGTATITVTVNDGGASNNVVTRTFTVTVSPVNDPPTLNPISDVALNETAASQTVNLSGIGAGAANEAQTLTVTATSGNTALIPNPAVTYTSPNTTGTLTFTPVTNAIGTATITVTVNDGGASNSIVTRTFTVTVNAVNELPTLAALSDRTINEDAGVQTVNLSGISSGAATGTQLLTVTAASSKTGLIPNPTVTYTSPNSTGTLNFTPVSNANGTASITVTVNSGGTSSNKVTRTFTVTVNPVNDPPTLNAISDVTLSESASTKTVNLSGISSGATNESQTVTVTAVSSDTSLIPNPTVAITNGTGTLKFKPVTYAFGAATVTVTAHDGGASNNIVTRTFLVTVTPVNQAPTLSAISSLTINEGAGLQTVNLAGITSGMTNENQTLIVTAVSSNPSLIPNPTVNYISPATNGTLTFTPATYAYGTATITVTVNDGGAANSTVTRTFTVTVKSVNQPPTLDPVSDLTIIAGERGPGTRTVTLSGITSGAPNENQTITVTAASSNPGLISNPTVSYTSPNSTGTMTFTPVTAAYGTARLTVTVRDGGASNNVVTRTFTVAIVQANEPPTLNPLTGLNVTENAGTQTVALSGITSGATNEFQTLGVSARSSNPGLIPNPTVNYTSPNSAGTLSFTPVTDAFGGALITVTVNDGQANGTVTRSFWVGVSATVAQLSVGSTVLQAGQSGSVPVNLSSSEGVTDLNILLDVPPGHLTNLALQALAPEIDSTSATLVPLGATTTLVHLAARPGQSLLGSKQLAQLTFTAIANRPSAFVPLNALPFSATKADGSLLTDRPAQSGRAVVVGTEALLEATLDASGNRSLILYGKPSSSFAIEYTTSLSSPRTWTRLSPSLSLTSLATPVPLPGSAPAFVLYRAAQLSAAP